MCSIFLLPFRLRLLLLSVGQRFDRQNGSKLSWFDLATKHNDYFVSTTRNNVIVSWHRESEREREITRLYLLFDKWLNIQSCCQINYHINCCLLYVRESNCFMMFWIYCYIFCSVEKIRYHFLKVYPSLLSWQTLNMFLHSKKKIKFG